MCKHYKHVNVGYWNIHSFVEKVNNTAFNKLSDDDVIRVLKRMDLFCLSETHVSPDFNTGGRGAELVQSLGRYVPRQNQKVDT